MTRDEHIARHDLLVEEYGRCTDENEGSVLLQQIGELEIMLFHTAPLMSDQDFEAMMRGDG